jgi:hypothetical protein
MPYLSLRYAVSAFACWRVINSSGDPAASLARVGNVVEAARMVARLAYAPFRALLKAPVEESRSAGNAFREAFGNWNPLLAHAT